MLRSILLAALCLAASPAVAAERTACSSLGDVAARIVALRHVGTPAQVETVVAHSGRFRPAMDGIVARAYAEPRLTDYQEISDSALVLAATIYVECMRGSVM